MNANLVHIAAIYIFVMLGLRALGKRELGNLSPFELVTLMLIPEIVSPALSSQASLSTALAGVSVLFLLVFLSSTLAHRFRGFRRLTEADPTVLIKHGRLCEDMMNRERVTADEIFAEMHKQGITSLASVRWAILESDGEISIIREPDAPSPTGGAAERD